MSRALARDRLGMPAVLAFLLAGVAPLTVAAGVIPAAYAATGLAGIPAAFVAVAAVLGLFAAGYMAMARRITNAGAFSAFIAAGLGRVPGTAAALVAVAAYSLLQVALYGAFGPAAAAQAAALGVHGPWWAWALAAWTVITVLGLLRVDIAGKVLGVLTGAEIAVVIAEAISGLASPAGGHLSLEALSPGALGSAGPGAAAVLAVVAVLGFTGFEQAPVLAEEARQPGRTIPAATYLALGVIAVVYAGSAWAMAVHAGTAKVAAAAAAQGPGLLFGLGGGPLPDAARWLFLTSLFAAMLAFHNCVWRYTFALGREGVLPAALSRTGAGNIPVTASLAQSATGLAVITGFAAAGAQPMQDLFFDLGTTGGFGLLLLYAATSIAVVAYFARHPGRETMWVRLIAPGLAAVLLTAVAVLAVLHYGTLLGVPPGSPAAWALPAGYAAVTAAGLAWALILKTRRPQAYHAIGLGAHAPATPAAGAAAGGRS